MTDYLAFDIMGKTLNVMVAESEWKELPYIQIIVKLASIVGMDILKNAYFYGQLREFEQRLEKNSSVSQQILRALNFRSSMEHEPTEDDRLNVLRILSS